MIAEVEVFAEDDILLPGGNTLVRETMAPCEEPGCGEVVFEIVRRPAGSVWVQCPACQRRIRGHRNGHLLGFINMASGKTSEAK